MGAFAPSLLEWVGFKSNGVADFAISAPRSLGVPALGLSTLHLPLHGAICWLGILFMFLMNVTEDIPACKKRATNNMKKTASVQVHVFIRQYIS